MIRAGYIQFSPILGQPQATVEKVKSLLLKATEADLLVLPELANSGYNFSSAEHAYALSEPVNNSPFIDLLTAFSEQHNVVIVTGFNERAKDIIYNSALLITPEGISGKYRKIHLFMHEKKHFAVGNLGLPVFDTGFCKLGMQICFDYIFPEPWRILGLKGADLICHPSNLVTLYAHKVLPAQALMNRLFIITCNRFGTEGELSFTGQSLVANPEGDIIRVAPKDAEDVALVDIDISLARNKMITPLNHVFHDRFPEQYKELGC